MTPGTWNLAKMGLYNFLQFSWPRMKPYKNWMLQFSLIFVTPGTWNLAKIRLYNFLQFSWPQVHETLQKSDFTIFSNFHDPGYMKPWKNWMLQFSLIFMTPGTQNLAKIRLYNFLQFPWPRVHETWQKSDASIFSNFHDPGHTKPCKNQTLQFSPIFMTPRTWNLAKIGCFNFLQFSWPRVHETLQKSDFTIFSNFHDPAYMKPCKNWMLQFSLIFMTPGTRNLAKIRLYNFL